MDMQDWSLLLALVEEKSMGKAGEKLFLSQPAVVYRLNRMEKEFGTVLFVRNNRGVQFTEAGQKLSSHASDILREYNSICQEIQQCGSGLCGNITVGSSSTFLSHFLPEQLKSFYQSYPSVTISLVAKRNDELIEMLNNGQISVAVVRGNHEWNGSSCHLYDDPFVVISSHPCTVEDLKHTPYISYSGDPELIGSITRWGHELLNVPFITTTDATRVTGPQICIQLVKAGLGWSVVPLTRTLGESDLFKIALPSYSFPHFSRPTQLLYTKGIYKLPLYSAYIEHFKSFFSHYSFPSLQNEVNNC